MTAIYVIQSGNHCKVGISGDVTTRLASLQTGSPTPLSLTYSRECGNSASKLEAEAHKLLKDFRRDGEWFEIPAHAAAQAVMDAADSLGLELSDPTPQSGEMITMRVDERLLKTIDDWRREEPDLPVRSKAIRRMIEAEGKRRQKGKRR